MATKISLITAKDYFEVAPEGGIDLNVSRQRLLAAARSEQPPADYDLLIDFRATPYPLSLFEVTELASEPCQRGDTFRRKVALLVLPGISFDQASFFETYSLSHGFFVNAFIDSERAPRWLLSPDEPPTAIVAAPPTSVSDEGFPRLTGGGWQQ